MRFSDLGDRCQGPAARTSARLPPWMSCRRSLGCPTTQGCLPVCSPPRQQWSAPWGQSSASTKALLPHLLPGLSPRSAPDHRLPLLCRARGAAAGPARCCSGCARVAHAFRWPTPSADAASAAARTGPPPARPAPRAAAPHSWPEPRCPPCRPRAPLLQCRQDHHWACRAWRQSKIARQVGVGCTVLASVEPQPPPPPRTLRPSRPGAGGKPCGNDPASAPHASRPSCRTHSCRSCHQRRHSWRTTPLLRALSASPSASTTWTSASSGRASGRRGPSMPCARRTGSSASPWR
mmetsp:Transcript_85714/g.227761  ORF Transcript_85714/g.227761 Transcript_85714/m.227761 type:complete len:292 (+) Transcript_85714:300-1175(+)